VSVLLGALTPQNARIYHGNSPCPTGQAAEKYKFRA
jgi:hypothetical protein